MNSVNHTVPVLGSTAGKRGEACVEGMGYWSNFSVLGSNFGDVVPVQIRVPDVTGLAVRGNAVGHGELSGRFIHREFFGFLVEFSESAAPENGEPDIVILVHFHALDARAFRRREGFHFACFRIQPDQQTRDSILVQIMPFESALVS